jgi:hypothetical protein
LTHPKPIEKKKSQLVNRKPAFVYFARAEECLMSFEKPQ